MPRASISPGSPALTPDTAGKVARGSPAGLAYVASRGRWLPARHLLAIDEQLCRVERGEIDRLMIFQPPRSGKAMLTSEFTPAWYLGRHPDRRVILCSYGAHLASNWGRKARDVLAAYGPEFFDVRVATQSKAADHWNLQGEPGGMNTAGVGGPITGFGADLLIIDDPLKDAEEAGSEVIRAKQIDWWQAVARTRLMAGGAVDPDADPLARGGPGGLAARGHEARRRPVGGALAAGDRRGRGPARPRGGRGALAVQVPAQGPGADQAGARRLLLGGALPAAPGPRRRRALQAPRLPLLHRGPRQPTCT